MTNSSRSLRGFVTLFLCLSHATLYAADETGLPFVRNYPAREYNAGSQNWCVLQSPEGLIYAGNGSGVLEYDGVDWRLIPVSNRSVVRSMALDPLTGTIYVGAQGEFGYLASDRSGRTVYTSLLDCVDVAERTFVNVWRTWTTRSGIYFQANTHIFRWSEGRITAIKPRTSFHFSFQVDDRLFVLQRDVGLQEIIGDGLRLCPGTELLSSRPVYAMMRYDAARIMIATRSGLFLWNGSGLQPFAPDLTSRLERLRLYNGLRLPDSTFALATLEGGVLVISRSGKVQRIFDETAGLQNHSVKAMYVDRQNGLWLALERGLARIEYASPLSRFNASLNFRSQVETVHRYRGSLYVGNKEGLFTLGPRRADGSAPLLIPVPGVEWEVWSFLPFRNGLLVATYGSGTLWFEGGRRTRVGPFNGASLARSHRDSNRVFVGLFDGLAAIYYKNGRWMDEGRIEGVHDDIRTMAEDEDGALWLGQITRGCTRIAWGREGKKVSITRYDTAHGLPDEGINVYGLFDHVYFGTDRGQMFRFVKETGRFVPDTTVAARLGVPGKRLIPRSVDDAGNVWSACLPEAGEDWYPAVSTRQEDGSFVFRPLMQGRITCQATGALYRDEDRIVWFQSGEELIRFDLNLEPPVYDGCKVLVRHVRTSDDSLIYAGGTAGEFPEPVLSYDLNSFRIEFAALSYDDERGNRYRFRLEGFDERWSGWTAEPHKEYTNLSEGRYRFMVVARNVYGQESPPAVFSFTLLPPWYRTWWAYGIYVMLAAAAAYGGIQWRLRLLTKRTEDLERSVDARTRELESANREIEAQRDYLQKVNRQLASTVKELKETQTQLVQSEKMGALGQMVAGLAHEINNPLTFVIGNLYYVRDHLGDSAAPEHEELKDAILASLTGATRIKSIVESLGTFVNLNQPSLQPMLIHRNLDLVVDLFIQREPGIRVVRQYDRTLDQRPILANPGELNLCFHNILTNAVQAIRDAEQRGTLTPQAGRVTLTTSAEPGGLRVRISDNGIGMNAAVREKIFEPFFTTRPVGSGKGLGLYETYAVITRHKGSIEVHSEPGKGTEMVLHLPWGSEG
jgi:signal transduction histidine kinase/ligand-binding sensor domain-containing protein